MRLIVSSTIKTELARQTQVAKQEKDKKEINKSFQNAPPFNFSNEHIAHKQAQSIPKGHIYQVNLKRI